ncbi:sigma-70 factor domain-containing protein [Segatella paludivivens]|uniref:sigma-70 factor domain-containing protein n=1 Tax=Segatella paludivivens TaxID=185294 RepID=UPI000AC68864|nr:sigma-70 factor domain-containing protein [Segatella paludivivens]
MRKIKTGKPLSERENGSLNRYLDEIGKELLLSDDEEKQLAEKIQNGGRVGERAVEKLVTSNLRFVVSIAKLYTDNGVAITDLISEGNIGMMKLRKALTVAVVAVLLVMLSLLFVMPLFMQ